MELTAKRDSILTEFDLAFLSSFEACDLEPGTFTHKAHIRLAWINLNQNSIDQAIDASRRQLKAFVKAVGAEEKYHETVTVAAVRIVYHFFLKDKGGGFEDFIEKHPRLLSNFKELYEGHYGFDLFGSQEAKENYVEPDKMAFD